MPVNTSRVSAKACAESQQSAREAMPASRDRNSSNAEGGTPKAVKERADNRVIQIITSQGFPQDLVVCGTDIIEDERRQLSLMAGTTLEAFDRKRNSVYANVTAHTTM